MRSHDGFDLWADSYDASVKHADESGQYPFAGYHALMNAIYGTVMARAPARVLDIGFGTAMLTSRLYQGGNQITGIDFSAEMLNIAQQKMPGATLLQWDFSNGIPPELNGRTFDFILSTYALHHLMDDAKLDFITQLLNLLAPEGKILIGDVCFPTREALLSCRASCGADWDGDEFYFVSSELEDRLGSRCALTFHEFSFCSAVVEIQKRP